MKTLTINQERLVEAIMALAHVSGPAMGQDPVVAYFPDREEQEVTITWDGKAPYIGQVALTVWNFLVDDGNDYTWGEQGSGSGEDGEWTEVDNDVAWSWVLENLLTTVDLDGEEYTVKYI